MRTLQLREGIFGGVVAGIVMAMVAMMYTFVTQGDLLAPLAQMGALFFPSDRASAIAMLAGMMLHVMTAAILGGVFVLLARTVMAGGAAGFWPLAIAGMTYIVVEWLLAAFVILPAVDRPLLATFATIGGFVAHAMFGLVLAWWLVWRASPVAIDARTGAQHHAA
jgi:hypothetical protein